MFKALRNGAKKAGWPKPPSMYAWRFDQVMAVWLTDSLAGWLTDSLAG
jgi:hypothetical protein